MALTLKPTPDPAADKRAAEDLADAIERGAVPADGVRAYTVPLQARHADYLERRAAEHGETPERHLERILRLFWQTDTWRLADTRPSEKGEPAGTGLR